MILVTGAAGLCGQAIVSELARRGVRVRALVRRPIDLPAEVVVGDLRDPGPALDGVTRALLLSAGDEGLRDTQCAFIDAARRAGVPHVVKFSGRGAATDSGFRFTRLHSEVEQHLERSGLAWTHLRPSQFMEAYLRDAAAIARTGVLALPMADARVAPVAVADVASAAASLLTTEGHEGQRHEMSGPESLSMADVAARIAQATGRPARYQDVSPQQAAASWRAAGMPEGLAAALTELFGERRRGADAAVDLTTHRAFAIAPTPFLPFAQRHAAVFRGEQAPPPFRATSHRRPQ